MLPPGVVVRPRLLATLDAGTELPLTLVSGSAGTGKTALIATWLAAGRPPGPVAWLTLDTVDNQSRARFWRGVLSALGDVGVDVGVDLLAAASVGAVDAALQALSDVLSRREAPVVLVLDDFGLIDDGAILADVYQLLRDTPPALRMIAAVRGTPSMRLQRLRLAGAVCEIDPAQLAFTLEESVELLASSGVVLEPQVAERLWESTEGWGAGLQLAALSLRDHPRPRDFVARFAGDVAPVSDYLLEEVIARQPLEVRDFLLETSVVDHVSGALADALTGGKGGGVLLAELHLSGTLTTALDDRREWYRYHPLLLSMLRTTLRRDDPALTQALHQRAARWLAGHEREADAAHHAILAGDPTLPAEIVVRSGVALLARGELEDLARVLRDLPLERLRHEPMLTVTIAAAAIDAGDAEAAGRWLAMADQAAELVQEAHRDAFVVARAVIGLHRARMTADVDEALAGAQTIVEAVPGGALDRVGDPGDLRALALLLLGGLELWSVSVEVARRNLERGLREGEERDRPYLVLYGTAHLSMCHVWTGELTEAERLAHAAVAIAERCGWRNTPRTATALAALGAIATVRGDFALAGDYLAAAEQNVREWQDRPLRAYIGMARAQVRRLAGRASDGDDVLEALEPELGASPFLAPLVELATAEQALTLAAAGRRSDAIVLLRAALPSAVRAETAVALARLLVDDGDPEAALELLAPWTAEGPGVAQGLSTAVHAGIAAARAHAALGDQAAADAALEHAVALAEPEAARAPFMEVGRELERPLRQLLAAGRVSPVFVHEVIGLIGAPNDPLPDRAVTPTDGLTERELTILRFLPTAMSNTEIGLELFLSVNTVKSHVRQIYRKLDAHDRRQAVTRARQLGLLTRGPRLAVAVGSDLGVAAGD